MGKRGPSRTPTKQLAARGSWRAKDRLKAGEVTPESKAPSRPAWLDKQAAAVWRLLIPKLHDLGLLAEIDRNALARYCTLMGAFRVASEVIKHKGPTRDKHAVVDGSLAVVGYEDRPEVARRLRLDERLGRLEAKFGMTASDRAGLAVMTSKPAGKNAGKTRFFESGN